MSEKPVVDLLVTLTTNFKKAIGELDKVEKAIGRVLEAVTTLERTRVTVDIDVSGLHKGVQTIEKKLSTIKSIIEEGTKEGALTEGTLKTLQQKVSEVELLDRLQKRALEDAKKDADGLRETVKVMRFQQELAKGKQDALKKASSAERDIASHAEDAVTPMAKFRNLMEQAEGATEGIGNLSTLLKQAEPSAANIRKSLTVGEIQDVQKEFSKWQDRLSPVLKQMQGQKKLAEDIESKTIDVNAASKKQITTWQEQHDAARDFLVQMDQIEKYSKTIGVGYTKMSAAAKVSTDTFTKLTGVTHQLFSDIWSISDRMNYFRVRKFPFFREFQLPEDFRKDLFSITEHLKDGADLYTIWTHNLRHAMGVAKTYTGQFDRRMRYLSRDMYIFGIYMQQMSATVQRSFKRLIVSSSDLESAFEDVGLAVNDALEPIAETLAPIIERIADMIEVIGEWVDASGPLKGIIGIFALVGTVVLVVVASYVRMISVWNLFINSSMVMIEQQKKLTAAQEDHERHLYDLGVQAQAYTERLKEMQRQGIDNESIQAEFITTMRDLRREIVEVTREIINFGGDTSRVFELFEAGRRRVALGLRGGGMDPSSWFVTTEEEPELGERNFREQTQNLYRQETSLAKYLETLQKNRKAGVSTIGVFKNLFKLFTFGVKSKPEDILGDLTAELDQMEAKLTVQEGAVASQEKQIRVQGKQNKLVSKGSSSVWRLVGAFAGLTVTGAIYNAVALETQEISSNIFDIVTNLVEAFGGLFNVLEGLTGWLADFTAQYGAGPGALLAGLVLAFGAALLTGISMGAKAAGAALFMAVKGWFTAGSLTAVVMGGLKGIGGAILAVFSSPIAWIILLIAGIWLAWKTNFLNIREWSFKVFESIAGWIDALVKKVHELVSGIQKAATGATGGFVKSAQDLWSWIASVVPRFQTGGFVKRTGLAMVHSGETIVPGDGTTRDLSRSSVINHIYVDVVIDKTIASNIDERQIGRIVSEEIASQLRRRL